MAGPHSGLRNARVRVPCRADTPRPDRVQSRGRGTGAGRQHRGDRPPAWRHAGPRPGVRAVRQDRHRLRRGAGPPAWCVAPGRRMIQAARAWHAQVCPHTARHPGMRGDWQKDSDEDRAASHSISRADARISPSYRGPSGRCRLCRALPVIPHCSGAVTGRAAGRMWLVSGTRQAGMLSSTPQKEPERVHTY